MNSSRLVSPRGQFCMSHFSWSRNQWRNSSIARQEVSRLYKVQEGGGFDQRDDHSRNSCCETRDWHCLQPSFRHSKGKSFPSPFPLDRQSNVTTRTMDRWSCYSSSSTSTTRCWSCKEATTDISRDKLLRSNSNPVLQRTRQRLGRLTTSRTPYNLPQRPANKGHNAGIFLQKRLPDCRLLNSRINSIRCERISLTRVVLPFRLPPLFNPIIMI